MTPSSSSLDNNSTASFQLSLIKSSLANWTTTTVLLDHIDINAENTQMFNILSDYFSLYFLDGTYGHPGVVAYEQLPSCLKPFGGVDTRLFLSRPHICIFEGDNVMTHILLFSLLLSLFIFRVPSCPFALRRTAFVIFYIFLFPT